jgi:hypothetical protein
MANCRIHPKTKLVTFCPKCRGGATSVAKAKSARANGRLGGRPKLPAHSPITHKLANDPRFKKRIAGCAGCLARTI